MYDLQDVENIYHSSSWYRQQRTMFYAASDLLRNASVPFILSYGMFSSFSISISISISILNDDTFE